MILPKFAIMSTYDTLHRQCRTLESLFDTKLMSYARLASTVTRNPDDLEAGGSAERWQVLEWEVEELLQKVRMYSSSDICVHADRPVLS